VQEALERSLGELVFGPAIDVSDRTAVLAWLGEQGVSASDASAIAETELPHLLVYRRLVRGTLREALRRAIPRSLARLGEHFDPYFDRFLRDRGPQTHYLRDVTFELLDFMSQSTAEDPCVPSYWLDLARHEALHIEVAATPVRRATAEPAALELDAGLAFSESVRLVHYAHAVHTLPDDLNDRQAPAREPTYMLAYRDADHDVRYLALTELAAAVLERLRRGSSLRQSLTEAAAEKAVPLDESTLDATAALLADLAERGVILGPRAADGSAHTDNPATLDGPDEPSLPRTPANPI
jgi:hypothetical protein